MNDESGIDIVIAGERYVSLDVFVSRYFGTTNLFQGYVIGYGYVRIVEKVVSPSHLNGYSPEVRRLPYEETHFIVVSEMQPDKSPAAIKQSLKGLFVDGQATITVKSGMTLSGIAALFGVTVDDLVCWNKIENPDKITVGQEITVVDKNFVKYSPIDSLHFSYSSNSTVSSNEGDSFLYSKEMGLIALGLTGISTGLSAYSELSMYNKMATSLNSKCFLARYNGSLVVWSNKFRGNSAVGADFVVAQKASYLSRLNQLKWVKWGGTAASVLGLGISVSQMYNAKNAGQQAEATFDTFMGTLGLTGVGWSTAALYSLSAPLRKIWQEKVLTVQMETGIEGCASVMPFK